MIAEYFPTSGETNDLYMSKCTPVYSKKEILLAFPNCPYDEFSASDEAAAKEFMRNYSFYTFYDKPEFFDTEKKPGNILLPCVDNYDGTSSFTDVINENRSQYLLTRSTLEISGGMMKIRFLPSEDYYTFNDYDTLVSEVSIVAWRNDGGQNG